MSSQSWREKKGCCFAAQTCLWQQEFACAKKMTRIDAFGQVFPYPEKQSTKQPAPDEIVAYSGQGSCDVTLMTPATFIVRAEVRPISMKTLMLSANAAPALVMKMKGLKSTFESFITGLSSSCTESLYLYRDLPELIKVSLHETRA